MQRLEVSGAVWPIYGSLGVKRLIRIIILHWSKNILASEWGGWADGPAGGQGMKLRRNFVICTLYQVLGWSHQQGWMNRMHGRDKKCIQNSVPDWKCTCIITVGCFYYVPVQNTLLVCLHGFFCMMVTNFHLVKFFCTC